MPGFVSAMDGALAWPSIVRTGDREVCRGCAGPLQFPARISRRGLRHSLCYPYIV